MLTKMEVYSPRTSAPILPLSGGGPSTDPIDIRNIEGLGPVKASVNTSPFGSIDGESYSGSSIGKRNIVMTLGFNPDWKDQSMSSLRQRLYAYFMSGEAITLRFFSDVMPDVHIRGYVESVEPNMFSRDPEVQVSIICPLPEFIAIEPTTVTDIVGDGTTSKVVNYLGSIPTGFKLRVESSPARPAYTGRFTIVNNTPFSQIFSAEATVDAAQHFEMSSVQGLKYVRNVVTLGGVIKNLLSTIELEAVWPRLEPGTNEFSVQAVSLGQKWTLTYFNRFGGL